MKHGSSVYMFRMQQGYCKKHKAVQDNIYDRWVCKSFNNLNTYTYKKLKKDKSLWCCMYFLQKGLLYSPIKNGVLNDLIHGNRTYIKIGKSHT